jgi:predicted GNAT family acetyltransferase
MIRKLNEADREKAVACLEKMAAYTVFFVADLDKFGFDSDFFSLWGEEDGAGSFEFIFGRFFDTLILFSVKDTFDAPKIARFLKENGIGYKVLVARDRVFMEYARTESFSNVHRAYLCELTRESFRPVKSDIQTDIARKEDVRDICALRDTIEEFREFTIGPEEMEKSLTGSRGIVVREGGRVVSVAMCSAVTAKYANIGGVCTYREYRGRGYAGKAVSDLSAMMLDAGLNCILSYDNPEAGSIYRRLGYKEIGFMNLAIK